MIGVDIIINSKQFALPGLRSPKTVIADFALTIPPGQFVCLIGPSGCGKSTLLHAVAGLDPDFSGAIRFPGGPPVPRLGYMFQDPRLLPWRTVRQNIELALSTPEASRPLIDHLLEVMGLHNAQHEFPERLSLGMSRRVALARAFAIEPDLLLMDEPFVSLDAATARRVRKLLLRVWAERRHTVLFVTHDLREAVVLADRLVFLSASPMRVVRDLEIDLPRQHRIEDTTIEQLITELVKRHPEIAVAV